MEEITGDVSAALLAEYLQWNNNSASGDADHAVSSHAGREWGRERGGERERERGRGGERERGRDREGGEQVLRFIITEGKKRQVDFAQIFSDIYIYIYSVRI